jgi:hypothetical protein
MAFEQVDLVGVPGVRRSGVTHLESVSSKVRQQRVVPARPFCIRRSLCWPMFATHDGKREDRSDDGFGVCFCIASILRRHGAHSLCSSELCTGAVAVGVHVLS